MAAFRNYNGPDKYHFRVYKKGRNHPVVIVMVVREEDKDGRILLSGYPLTHSIERVMSRPNIYVRLNKNPNANDDTLTFLCTIKLSEIDSRYFSKPYPNWHLSKEDEQLIDQLLLND